jgi:hypothetical protein
MLLTFDLELLRFFAAWARPRETGRYGRSERDRQRRWHYEKCGRQECDEKAAGHHFLPVPIGNQIRT